ncbi:MAG: TldD/PmbA family protein [Nitrososphaerales archaeon]|jgi:TldD protein
MTIKEEAKELANLSIREAERLGADYSESRVQGGTGSGFMLKNGEPQPSMMEDSFGLGIRVLCGGALAFSATNIMERASVRALTAKTVKMAKATQGLVKKKVRLDGSRPARRKFSAPEKEPIEGGDAAWLKSILVEIDRRVQAGRGAKIPNRIFVAVSEVDEKYYVNTDGAETESRTPRIHFFGILTAISDSEVAQRMVQQGETGGLEVVKRIDLVSKVESEARTLRRVLAKARKMEPGEMDVILSSELSGIAAHESVGHPQEADRILGREGAQAGESYLKRGSIGRRIGSAEAHVSDDPTIVHSNGYCPVDDEGVEATKRRLIVGGEITEFLQNRSTAAELRAVNNGSARSAGFNREPIIRMSNTFVEPGDHTLEELVREVKHGIYLKSFTEWNIDDKRLNQRYVGLEAYRIEHGELGEMVKAPVLEITTPALWSAVRARSRKMEFEAATCGKGDPMQGIPVWTGGPDTLLGGVRVSTR